MNETTAWRASASVLAPAIARRDITARAAVEAVLARIDACNPEANALVEVMHAQARQQADAADAKQTRGEALGPLHGVPITIKVNVDVQGHATTDGVPLLKDNLAQSDSPLVQSLREAGAIIVGRSNTPAFSVRWFTDNDLHGRTLNPFDAGVTPGGSSGGAAAAVALGMGAIAHGNDYGGSIRYPAWACGVVGLRPTVGRIPSYKASAPNRILSNQMMSVQGPLTRCVADARLALAVMAQGSPTDPGWNPVPLTFADAQQPVRVAMMARHPAYDVDPSVEAAVRQAAQWLSAAGYAIEEVQAPRFEEGAALWNQLVQDDMRRGAQAAIEAHAGAGTRNALHGYMANLPGLDRDQTLDAYAERFNILREWGEFMARYPLILMPNSWQRQFPIDADQRGDDAVKALLQAQAPLLGTAMMGLPGLSVPTGLAQGLPTGVQLVAWRYREDQALAAGEVIERAAGYDVLRALGV